MMATRFVPPDEITTLQREILSTLEKSHRLFSLRFYFVVSFLIVLTIAMVIVGISMNAMVPGSGSTNLISLITVAIISLLSFRDLGKHLAFIRWSGSQLRAMDSQILNSKDFVGLSTYINKLVDTVYTGTFWGWNTIDDKSPARMVESLHNHENQTQFIFILILGVFCFFTIFLWVTMWSKQSGGVLSLTFECVSLAGLILLTKIQHMWSIIVQSWGGYYSALDRWGEKLREKMVPDED